MGKTEVLELNVKPLSIRKRDWHQVQLTLLARKR